MAHRVMSCFLVLFVGALVWHSAGCAVTSWTVDKATYDGPPGIQVRFGTEFYVGGAGTSHVEGSAHSKEAEAEPETAEPEG